MNSIVGLVVEFVVAIDEARVRFTDDALFFLFLKISFFFVLFKLEMLVMLFCFPFIP